MLEHHHFDLERAIENNGNSPLQAGSEFRPVNIIEPIFSRHPLWIWLQRLLKFGSDWKLDMFDHDQRRQDLTEALTFGNHKGATTKQTLLRDLIWKDVKNAYGLVIPLKSCFDIPGALVAPMNIMCQNAIDENGNIIQKIDSPMIFLTNGHQASQ